MIIFGSAKTCDVADAMMVHIISSPDKLLRRKIILPFASLARPKPPCVSFSTLIFSVSMAFNTPCFSKSGIL